MINNVISLASSSEINQKSKTTVPLSNSSLAASEGLRQKTSLEELSERYDLRSMSAEERQEFANEAVSIGALTLREAAGLLPLPNIQRVESENGDEVTNHGHGNHNERRFDVIAEIQKSVEFSKENGGSKGIQLRENLLIKLQHIEATDRISLSV